MTAKQKVIFLDRDGVINVDFGYVYQWENFLLTRKCVSALKTFLRLGYELILISNQSGIARGYFTESDLNYLHEKLIAYLKYNNINILDIFYCPHFSGGVVAEFSIECSCRKPKPGMIVAAADLHNIDLEKSFLVGDNLTDIKAGHDAGVGCNVLISKENLIINRSYHVDKQFRDVKGFSNYLNNLSK